MNNDFCEEEKEIIFDYEECVDMILEKTGLPTEMIVAVLNVEVDYMKSIGIIDEDADAYYLI